VPSLSQQYTHDMGERIIAARRREMADMGRSTAYKEAEEGGCGVVGFCASVPVRGRHIFEPSIQMHNRGNGKGGGIAAACLLPEQMGVDAETLRQDYILQVALLDDTVQREVEETYITPYLRVDHQENVKPACDYRDLGLEVRPPDVARYFVRVKDSAINDFRRETGLADAADRVVEDEFIYRNSARLNQKFYASLGDKRAFVLSHARNLLILKIVGYAENVVKYYGMDDFKANIWIAHQRYPTKGRVWHPGGSHPFIGLNEALVHNGDFANYHSVSEYLRQHGITTSFLTDTEVSVLMFDLLRRTYAYPLEYVIEALAPTTELDFERLPESKKLIYRTIQNQHMRGSPDGPWFFIIAGSDPDDDQYHLLGITDTAMLRPQVFALQEGDVSIGLVGSEKQAIDATLLSLNEEDPRFRTVADRYWNARGGSHTDGGAFAFQVKRNGEGWDLTCTDKFGTPIAAPAGRWLSGQAPEAQQPDQPAEVIAELTSGGGRTPSEVFDELAPAIRRWDFSHLQWLLQSLQQKAQADDQGKAWSLELLTLLNDRRYDCGDMKRSQVLHLVRQVINAILDQTPSLAQGSGGRYRRISWDTRDQLRGPQDGEEVLVVDGRGFEPEGDDCEAHLSVRAFQAGWRRFIIYGLVGQRFQGNGFGPDTQDVRMDIYGSSGDYLASGIDGMEMRVHDNGQDQLGQIMKAGRLVVYGDVGQAFMYGAKGGEVYIMGNAAGRPLINAVGRPRVVINGTCLDFLAESFMAGDPLNGGGFVVLNAVEFDDAGRVRSLDMPYPGANLFSLASGGAIYVRDPHHRLVEDQLNGGAFFDLTDEDWELIRPYLEANQGYFGISVEDDLLTVDGQRRDPKEVYRKVGAVSLAVLAKQAVPE